MSAPQNTTPITPVFDRPRTPYRGHMSAQQDKFISALESYISPSDDSSEKFYSPPPFGAKQGNATVTSNKTCVSLSRGGLGLHAE